MDRTIEDGTYAVRLNPYGKPNRIEHMNIKVGYAVGMVKGTVEKIQPENAHMISEALNRVTMTHRAAYVGVWTDEAGVIHIDPVLLIRTLGEALKVGKLNEQVAIWDFANFSEITL
jgi:hypothetical protein